MLMDHPNSDPDGIRGRSKSSFFSKHCYTPFIRMIEPIENIHQRRLAGAILSQEAMYLANLQIEVDFVVCNYAGESLYDSTHDYD
jgi:hypothetical protein